MTENAFTIPSQSGRARNTPNDGLDTAAAIEMVDDVSELRQCLDEERAAHAATRRELRALQRQLAATRATPERPAPLQGCESGLVDGALRGSNVAVFTQDRDLRYTSVSKPLFGCDSAEMLGRTDEEILSAENAAEMVAIKREVLANGRPKDAEIRVDRARARHWYDLHIEPLRDVRGAITGLTCAAVDITERKESEAHLRLVMRELTHRSKNLLAVIQAMARQTARPGGTIASFLERFGARLQALARAHDLLVRESWHGVSLHDLVRSQLGPYSDRDHPQVAIAGPDIQVKPEAAQTLSLAFHELASNAVKYGALSRRKGHVSVDWCELPQNGKIEIVWRERHGPRPTQPKRRGLGSQVIEQHLSRALHADVTLTFPPEGLTCRIMLPSTFLQKTGGVERIGHRSR
jgi:PAS domain S-box-containing protein